MNKMLRLTFLLFCLLLSIKRESIYAQDFIEDPQIKTLLLYSYLPGDKPIQKYRNSPIINLKSNQSLILEFDDLGTKHRSYRLKIFHLDASGQRSKLREFQYLNASNEFFINDFQVSQSTKVSYYHYRFLVPKTKISGDFMIQVYDSYDETKPLFQKYFSVVDPQISIRTQIRPALSSVDWRSKQDLGIELNLGSFFVSFPEKELSVKVVKNQNPRKASILSNQNLIRKDSKTYAFKAFDALSLFDGGNEHRFIDGMNLYSRSQNIEEIRRENMWKVISKVQKSRSKQNYAQSFDQNGTYTIGSIDASEPDTEADYFSMTWRVEKDINIDSVPILKGAFNLWTDQEMEWNPESNLFEYSTWLKQGVYDFLIEYGENFEGNHSETRNTYEILVYQRIPGKAFQELIAYSRIE
jgi:hypothetical protein